MRISKRLTLAGTAVAMVAAGLVAAGPASAANTDCALIGASTSTTVCDASYSAIVGSTGLAGMRYIQTAAVSPMVASNSTGSFGGSVTVDVNEVTMAGSNWSVTVKSSDLSNGSTAITAGNVLLNAGTPPAGVGCLDTTLLPALQCTLTGVTGSNLPLNLEQTLWSVSNTNSTNVYTGLYAGTGLVTLNVPNGSQTGTYNGAMTVTLYN